MLAESVCIKGPVLRAFNACSIFPCSAAFVSWGSSIAGRVLAGDSNHNTIFIFVFSEVIPSVAAEAEPVGGVETAAISVRLNALPLAEPPMRRALLASVSSPVPNVAARIGETHKVVGRVFAGDAHNVTISILMFSQIVAPVTASAPPFCVVSPALIRDGDASSVKKDPVRGTLVADLSLPVPVFATSLSRGIATVEAASAD